MCTKSFVLLRTFEVRTRTTDACAYVRRMVRTNDAYRTPTVVAYVKRTHRTIALHCMRYMYTPWDAWCFRRTRVLSQMLSRIHSTTTDGTAPTTLQAAELPGGPGGVDGGNDPGGDYFSKLP